jgi:hypothetical protein
MPAGPQRCVTVCCYPPCMYELNNVWMAGSHLIGRVEHILTGAQAGVYRMGLNVLRNTLVCVSQVRSRSALSKLSRCMSSSMVLCCALCCAVLHSTYVLTCEYVVELDQGDTLFFHCNLFHKSDKNTSPAARWSLISCYNAKRYFSFFFSRITTPPQHTHSLATTRMASHIIRDTLRLIDGLTHVCWSCATRALLTATVCHLTVRAC